MYELSNFDHALGVVVSLTQPPESLMDIEPTILLLIVLHPTH